jgi:alkylated DNA nucleotide flippase Atl1
MKEFRLRLRNIIASMRGRVVTPGDVVALTGLPRYEVLATFHILEALGIVELMNAKGNYRVYRLTDLGEKLLEALDKDYEIGLTVQPPSGGEVEAEA